MQAFADTNEVKNLQVNKTEMEIRFCNLDLTALIHATLREVMHKETNR